MQAECETGSISVSDCSILQMVLMCSFGLWESWVNMAKAKSSSSRANSSRSGNIESRNSIILLFTVATGKKNCWGNTKCRELEVKEENKIKTKKLPSCIALKESEMKSLHLTSVVKYQGQHMENVLSSTWAHYLDTISSLSCPKFPSFSSGGGQSTFSLSFVRTVISPSVLT